MSKKRLIKEATTEDEKLLVSVQHNKKDKVVIRNKTYNIGWIHPAVADWISDLAINGDDNKVLSQSAALIVLNGFWKCHLLYWFMWRWFYYVKQYNAAEFNDLFQMAQKKTSQEARTAYLSDMMLLTALSTTKKQMTMEEARRIHHELLSASGGK